MPPVALEFAERLSGSLRFAGGRDQPIRLDLKGRSIAGHRLRRFAAEGTLCAGSFARAAPVAGTITLAHGTLVYDLAFEDDRGGRLRLEADKRHLFADLYAGFTTLRGTVFEETKAVATFSARFDARGDLGWWLKNLRVTRA